MSFRLFIAIGLMPVSSTMAWMTMMATTTSNTPSKSSSEIPEQFPLSTRQALLQKARQLEGKQQQKKGQYAPSSWSNRIGSVLTPAAIPGVYTADRPFYWNKIDVGCRMTVIELPRPSDDSTKPDLWIHSPVMLDGPLQKVLDDMGTVKYVVSPNYEHVKFASQWAQAYPQAEIWACPGLREKEEPTTAARCWTHEIPFQTKYQELWPGIQALHIDCEVNPFTGKAFFNEVIFYHQASKTLLTTDLYWNYPASSGITNGNYPEFEAGRPWDLAPSVDSVPLGSKLWKIGMDQVYWPFYRNFMVTVSQSEFQQRLEELKAQWDDIDTVIPAHGDLLRGPDMVQSILFERHFGLTTIGQS